MSRSTSLYGIGGPTGPVSDEMLKLARGAFNVEHNRVEGRLYSQAFNEGLRSAIAAVLPGWRTIETAPFQEEVLVYDDITGVGVGMKCLGRDGEWWTYDIHELAPTPCELKRPTHWMPLPAPPAGTAASGSTPK